eukprot:CAMPEP_0194525970 /NCGR_PEP_ID=MMETSP0253-20130528/61639_1 /TAXON_ID=2966 /ORGANISM="Noctiluca scintillans" /LENGTH=150 /DNA_ID=CAMNT_0039370753 /DNA_START=110 /DNA_END=562 /DNA_ORIENTATION=+
MDADIGYEFSAENVVSDSKLFDYLTEAGANHFQEDASDGSGDDDHSGTPAQPEETEEDRGSIWSAVLHKRTGSFGLGIREVPETQTLLVQLVQNHGAVADWNAAHPSEEIRAGDIIIQANCQTSTQQIMQECRSAPRIVVVLRRPTLMRQ